MKLKKKVSIKKKFKTKKIEIKRIRIKIYIRNKWNKMLKDAFEK